MKRVIITGPTGAIGVALVQRLLEEGIVVVAIVNPESKRVDRLPKHERIQIVRCSLGNLHSLDEKELGTCDAFFHLAWMGTIGPQRDDMHLQNRNVSYALDAVELAKRCGCQVFLGAGSQAEYGRVECKLKADTPVNPEMGYGIAKLCAGQMTRLLCKQLGIRHVWTRILSIYGPYDGDTTMITSGIKKMLRGEIPSFSKGEQLWDYLYSGDAANALYLVAKYGKDGAIYPIGSGKTRPLKEYILDMKKAVENVIGKSIQVGIGELSYQQNQVMYLCADISKLSSDTGFTPKVSFEEGIANTVEWCRTQ